MKRLIAGTFVVLIPLTAVAQQPQIQNGRVETRQVSSIDKDVTALGATSTDPIWVAWREPMIDGRRNMCSWYSDDTYPNGIRGNVLEQFNSVDVNGNFKPPQITPPTGPVPLEGGTTLVIMARIVNSRVERMRTFSDDCPLDANGRTVYMLTGVSVADSLKFLETLTHPDYSTMIRSGADGLVSSAVSAIGLHRGPEADAILDRLATDSDSNVRRQAIGQLADARTAHGFETLKRLLDTEKSVDVRRSLANAIARTRQPQTADLLLGLAHNDADEQVRGDAAYNLAARGGERMVPEIVKIANTDGSTNVRQRAISGLGTLPPDISLPPLMQLARDGHDMNVRKQAIQQLGHSKDPRAAAFLQELLK